MLLLLFLSILLYKQYAAITNEIIKERGHKNKQKKIALVTNNICCAK